MKITGTLVQEVVVAPAIMMITIFELIYNCNNKKGIRKKGGKGGNSSEEEKVVAKKHAQPGEARKRR